MSAHVQSMLDRRQAVLKARATETLSEAQAALDRARARYNDPTSGSHGYDIARAQDRVEAAKVRVNASFQTLAEFAATPNGREYMDLRDETPGLMWELRVARMI